MTGMMSIEPEMLPSSGPITTGYDCQWYYWSSNQHASFVVWRQKSEDIGIRATIRYQDGTCAYTIIVPEHIKSRPITGTAQGLDTAKIAVNKHLGRIIQAAFHEG